MIRDENSSIELRVISKYKNVDCILWNMCVGRTILHEMRFNYYSSDSAIITIQIATKLSLCAMLTILEVW